MDDLDYPLLGFKSYLRSHNFSAATVEVYASVIRRALHAISPLAVEGLLQYAEDTRYKTWASTFRSAWRAFEKYAASTGAAVPALPRGKIGRKPIAAPAWAAALRALVDAHRLPVFAIPEIAWRDVSLGVSEGAVRWHGVGYKASTKIILALREAATPVGGKLDLNSPLVPEAPGSYEPMPKWRLNRIIGRAGAPQP